MATTWNVKRTIEIEVGEDLKEVDIELKYEERWGDLEYAGWETQETLSEAESEAVDALIDSKHLYEDGYDEAVTQAEDYVEFLKYGAI